MSLLVVARLSLGYGASQGLDRKDCDLNCVVSLTNAAYEREEKRIGNKKYNENIAHLTSSTVRRSTVGTSQLSLY